MKPLALLALSLTTTASAAETRCGILSNPTPQNYWLRDKHAEWTISEQGGFVAEGFDELPDMRKRGWVETNGSYGYGCACMRVEVDREYQRIARIISAKPVPLKQCRRDPALRRIIQE